MGTKSRKVHIEPNDIPLIQQYEQIVTTNFYVNNTAAISKIKTVPQKEELKNLPSKMFLKISDQKHAPELYKNFLDKRKQMGGKQEIDQIIAAVVPDFEYAEVIAAYLRGQAEVSLLYPCLERLREQPSEGRWMGALLKEFQEKYQNREFPRRCQALMLLWHSSYSCFFLIDDFAGRTAEIFQRDCRTAGESSEKRK